MRTMRCAAAAISGACVASSIVTPGLAIELDEQLEHAPAVLRIEVAGRLVGDEKRRAVDERAGDRAALQLAAGELLRVVAQAAGRARRAASSARAARLRRRSALAAEQQRQRDVLEQRQRRQQVEELEDEADALAPDPGQLVVAKASPGPRTPGARSRTIGRSIAPHRCSSVDLPQPDGPTSATNSPCTTSRLTPATACTWVSPVV